MKFLLGSNLKEQLGETEVTREAEMSGEKFGVTAELPQPARQRRRLRASWGRTLWWEVTGGDTQHRDPPGPADTRPLQSWSCAELRRGFGVRRSKFKSKFKSYLCHLFCCVTLSKSHAYALIPPRLTMEQRLPPAQAAVRIRRGPSPRARGWLPHCQLTIK